MEFFDNLLYFVIVIGVLVVVHELGHFLAARICGMRAEVFSVGFGSRLLGYNKKNGFSFWKLPEGLELEGNCDYRISLLPIGGYVKIAGMVDESMDAGFEAKEPQPWEFRSKNTFQKAFVLSAGVLMNALLAVAIFGGIYFAEGQTMFATKTIGYVQQNSLAETAGFKAGDEVLAVDGNQIETWQDFVEALTTKDFGRSRKIALQRNNETVTIDVDGSKIVQSIAGQEWLGIEPLGLKTYLSAVETLKPAGKAGLQAGDTILTLAGIPVFSNTQFKDILQKNKSTTTYIEWNRDGRLMGDSVTPNSEGMIGVIIGSLYTGEMVHKNYNILEAAALGTVQTYMSVNLFISSVGQIFIGNISFKQSIGGPIMIAKQASSHAERGILSFLSFMALLSISLAIINILPFPALDGGHLVFTLVEGIIRREVPVKIKMAFQQVGLVILLAFMAFVVYNDIIR